MKSEVEETKTIEPAPSSTGDEEGSKAGVRIQEDENVSTFSSDCPNKSTSYWENNQILSIILTQPMIWSLLKIDSVEKSLVSIS